MARGGGLEVYGALILRITLGAVFMLHAYRLLFVWGPTDMISFQRSYGLPLPAVTYWYAVLAFGAGGLLLILGVLVRWVALLALPVLAMWMLFGQGRAGLLANHSFELALVLFMATLAQSCLGAGAFTFRR
jgi:putative oxidoreductase